jgi:hypothetical protein
VTEAAYVFCQTLNFEMLRKSLTSYEELISLIEDPEQK